MPILNKNLLKTTDMKITTFTLIAIFSLVGTASAKWIGPRATVNDIAIGGVETNMIYLVEGRIGSIWKDDNGGEGKNPFLSAKGLFSYSTDNIVLMYYKKLPDRYLEGMKFKVIVSPWDPQQDSDGDLFGVSDILAFVSPSGNSLEWFNPKYKTVIDHFWKEEE